MKKFIIPLVLGIFIFSFVSVKFGDSLIENDRIEEAALWYHLAKIANPLDGKINQRIAMTEVLHEERKGESEETALEDKPLATGENINSAVLGASTTVPILMYHYIRINPDPNDRVGFNLSVTPHNFAGQMEYLATHGFHTITLDDLDAALTRNGRLPQKPVIITLDDGYRDSYDKAFPILKSHNLKAVNFVITGFVGGPRYLTWSQIEEMKNSGVLTFGSHTVNHIALSSVPEERVKKEVIQSKRELESHLGPIRWFAYPYGNVNNMVARVVAQSGYRGALGTNNGAYHSSDRMFTLPRIRIGGGDSINSFAGKLPWR